MFRHLYEILLHRVAVYPAAVALGSQDGDQWKTLDSTALLQAVDALAEQLADRGVKEGDRVILWLPSSWRTPVYLFALWKLGAIAVPFDREMNAEAARRIVASVEPRLILTGYAEAPPWAPAGGTVEWWEPPAARAAGMAKEWQPPTEDVAAIVFTSGTTGNPKGCMITHANLCFEAESARHNIPLDSSCRLASILPLSHLFELTGGLVYPLSMGAAIHYVPSRKGPDVIRVFQEQHITHMLAVPQLFTLMVNALDERMRSSLPSWLYRALVGLAERLPLPLRRVLFRQVHQQLGGRLVMFCSGGAALPPTTQRLWERIGVRMIEGYGSSECSPVIACGVFDGSTPAGSVGKPLEGVQVKLSPEGEILVKGPNVMKGYWNDPQRTAEVMQDGWYATGDLARQDEAGNLWLVGRAKDLIVLSSGLNVWPQDVEDVLRAEPTVKDAAVMAVPTADGGVRLHAYLLPRGEPSVEPQEVVTRANAHLAQHQRVNTASWWAEADFPRTSLLKVKRHLLPRPEVAPTRPIVPVSLDEPVAQAIAAAARVPSFGASQTLGELGLDSMGLLQLDLELEERTGKQIPDGDLRLDMTLFEVREVVAAAPAQTAVPPAGGAPGPGSQTAWLSTRHPAERAVSAPWPYTWGRAFRFFLSLPFDLLYLVGIKKTIVLGGENLADLPQPVIFAGTHHSFADLALLRFSLAKTPARRFAGSLVVAAAAEGFKSAGLYARYAILAFGLYPLRRFGGGRESLDELAAIAEAGNAVLVFPQGTHARPQQERDGDTAVAFKMGTAHLARGLGAVVIPFGLAGTEQAMPAHLEEFRGLVIAGIPVSLKRVPLAIAYGRPLRIEPEESMPDFTLRLQEESYALTRLAEEALAGRTAKRQPVGGA